MSYAKNEQEQLEEILSGRQYQVYYEDQRNFLERAWDFVSNWIMENIINKIFDQLGTTSQTGNVVVSIILFILALLVLLGLIMLIMRFVRKRNLKHYRPLAQGEELTWDYPEHFKAAQQYEDNQQYTLAARHHFLALLLRLDQENWLQAQQWKTNHEYYVELKKNDPEVAKQFYQLAVFFEKVMYGEHAITTADYQDFKSDTAVLMDKIQSQSHTKATGEQ